MCVKGSLASFILTRCVVCVFHLIVFHILDCLICLLLVSIYTDIPWKIMNLSNGFLTFCNENVLKKNSYCPFLLFVTD